MKLINRLRRLQRLGLLIMAGFAVVAIVAWSSASAANKKVSSQDEGFQMPDPDEYVTDVAVTPGSTTTGATTTYSLTLTVAQDIPALSSVSLNFVDSSCDRGFEFSVRAQDDDINRCDFDLTAATSSTHEVEPGDDSRALTVVFEAGQSAGTVVLELANVVNPTQSGSFTVAAHTSGDGIEGDNTTFSDPFVVGTVVVSGTVLDPDGDPVPYAWVDLASQDWSQHLSAGSDQNGFFAIVGDLPNGTYFLSSWPQQGSGFAQGAQVTVTYDGTPQTANYQFAAATKTLVVNAVYDTGGAVTVGQVNAWTHTGSGSNGNLDEDGQATLTLSGGQYDVSLGAPWSEDGQVQVDWISSDPQFVEFRNDTTEETKTLTMTVQKATAAFEGRILDDEGDPLNGAWIDFFKGEGRGANGGTDQDGEFSINVTAGTYEMQVWPGNRNDLYFTSRKVSIKDDQTVDLGDLTMSAYDAFIRGTVTDINGDPVVGGRVNGWVMDSKGWANTQTDADGNYQLGVFEGGWQVMLENSQDSQYVYSGEPQFVNVRSGQTYNNVDFEDVDIADATLRLQLEADDDGSVQDIFGGVGCREAGKGFKDMGGGVHGGIDRGVASLSLRGGLTYECDLWLPPEADYSVDGAIEVFVEENSETTEVVELKAHNATIRGWLKDQEGQVIRNTDVEIWAADDTFRNWRNTQLQSDGTFEMSVLDGTYMLGYWFRQQPGGESDYLQTHSEDNIVTVAEDGTVSKVLVAPRKNATVRGTILDPDGDPVEGHMWVGASNRFFLEDKVKADAEGATIIDTGSEVFDGEFEFGLVAGEHPVTGETVEWEVFTGLPPDKRDLGWMPPQTEPIAPEVGDEIELTLQYSLADATMSGTVTTEDGSSPEHGFVWAWNENGTFSGGEVWDGEFTVPLTMEDTPWHIGANAEVFGEGYYDSEEISMMITSEGDFTHNFTVTEYAYDVPEPSTFTFDAGSAFNVTLDDGTQISIPATALGEAETSIVLTATPKVDFWQSKDSQVAQGFVWDFEATADGQLVESFNQDVTIMIPYDEEVLEDLDGLTEDNITAQYFDETTNSWNSPTSTSVNQDTDYVTIMVDHFTQFGITGSGGVGSQVGGDTPTEKSFIASGYDNSGGPRIAKYTKDGALLATWEAYGSTLRMGVETLAGDGDGNDVDEVWTIPGEGYPKQVRRFDANGQVLSQFFTYENYTGRVESALYDVDGDGEDELVLVPATGPAHVTVWDQNGVLLSQFTAYEGYRGGVVMSVNDLDGDGLGEIVLATKSGHNHVTVWSKDGDLLTTWDAYSTTATGGVSSISTYDMDGNGAMEVVVGANERTSMARRFDKDGVLLSQFDTLGDPIANRGVRVWTLDSDGDGEGEVLSLMGDGSSFRKHSKDGTPEAIITGWPSDLTVGRMVFGIVNDVDGDGDDDLVTTLGPGSGPTVRIMDTRTGDTLSQWDALNEGYRGGVMLTPIAD